MHRSRCLRVHGNAEDRKSVVWMNADVLQDMISIEGGIVSVAAAAPVVLVISRQPLSNFLHSGTLALSPEHQSARMSKN